MNMRETDTMLASIERQLAEADAWGGMEYASDYHRASLIDLIVRINTLLTAAIAELNAVDSSRKGLVTQA